MKFSLLAVLLLVSSLAFSQNAGDEQQLEDKTKEVHLLQNKIAAKHKVLRAREIAGITVAAPGFAKLYEDGAAITLTYNGDDSDVLGGPADSWTWSIGGEVLLGKSVTFKAKSPGEYVARLVVTADHGHRQQSHSLRFRVNPPIEWEQADQGAPLASSK